MAADCIFCKIGSGEIPADLVYQDSEFVAFHDIAAQAPVHLIIIPKVHAESIMASSASEMIGRAVPIIQSLSRKFSIDNAGFRIVINTGADGGQSVFHLHIHLLGGRFMQWPPG